MSNPPATTPDRIVDAGRKLVMMRGYNGFSYADVAETVGVRKASIHHHFPAKADLAKAVIEQSRAVIRALAADLDARMPDAVDQLRAYTGFWERCIADGTAPFCLAAVLAAEMPSLPPDVSAAVQAHFRDLKAWLAGVLAAGVAQGSMVLAGSPDEEAEAVMAAVHGAMLAARVFDDPAKFPAITSALLRDRVSLRAATPAPT